MAVGHFHWLLGWGTQMRLIKNELPRVGSQPKDKQKRKEIQRWATLKKIKSIRSTGKQLLEEHL